MKEIALFLLFVVSIAVYSEARAPVIEVKEVIREVEKEVVRHCKCPCSNCQPGGFYYEE